jgi:diguanylate cyclase (GGDEF)-like protein
MNINEFLSKRRQWTLIVTGSFALVVIGTANLFAVSQLLEASVFFLIPVSFFTWFLNRRAGFLASAVSAVIVFLANLTSRLHAAHPWVGFWNALIWLGFFMILAVTVDRLKALYLAEKRLSRLDNLTRIANRLAFYEIATAEKNRARRFGQPVTIAYVDLDVFKDINDAMGHATRDQLLLLVARTMQKSVRLTDAVARIGGDEFAVLLPNTNSAAAAQVLTKLLHELNEGMEQNHLRVTFSIGAVTFLAPPESLQEMIKRADEAMYSAKAEGKNRLVQKEITA